MFEEHEQIDLTPKLDIPPAAPAGIKVKGLTTIISIVAATSAGCVWLWKFQEGKMALISAATVVIIILAIASLLVQPRLEFHLRPWARRLLKR